MQKKRKFNFQSIYIYRIQNNNFDFICVAVHLRLRRQHQPSGERDPAYPRRSPCEWALRSDNNSRFSGAGYASESWRGLQSLGDCDCDNRRNWQYWGSRRAIARRIRIESRRLEECLEQCLLHAYGLGSSGIIRK